MQVGEKLLFAIIIKFNILTIFIILTILAEPKNEILMMQIEDKIFVRQLKKKNFWLPIYPEKSGEAGINLLNKFIKMKFKKEIQKSKLQKFQKSFCAKNV